MKRGGTKSPKTALQHNWDMGVQIKSFVEVGKYSSVFLLRSRKISFSV